MVEVTSLTLVLPQEVETDSVACPPAFSILWKASNKIVSSSPIFSSESESIKKLQELRYKRPFTFVVSTPHSHVTQPLPYFLAFLIKV